jgi:hypothetical protein
MFSIKYTDDAVNDLKRLQQHEPKAKLKISYAKANILSPISPNPHTPASGR